MDSLPLDPTLSSDADIRLADWAVGEIYAAAECADGRTPKDLWKVLMEILEPRGKNLLRRLRITPIGSDEALIQEAAKSLGNRLGNRKLSKPDKIVGYFCVIVKRKAIDSARKDKRDRDVLYLVGRDLDIDSRYVAGCSPEWSVEIADEMEKYRKVIQAHLQGNSRRVFELILEDYSHGEISEILGISLQNVYTSLNRARGVLKSILLGGDDDPDGTGLSVGQRNRALEALSEMRVQEYGGDAEGRVDNLALVASAAFEKEWRRLRHTNRTTAKGRKVRVDEVNARIDTDIGDLIRPVRLGRPLFLSEMRNLLPRGIDALEDVICPRGKLRQTSSVERDRLGDEVADTSFANGAERPEVWRSMPELTGRIKYRGDMNQLAFDSLEELDRRRFFQILGASAALAGAPHGHWEKAKSLLCVDNREGPVPSKMNHYEVVTNLAGVARPVIMRNFGMRSMKTVSNTELSSEGTDVCCYSQAAVIDFYDPDHRGSIAKMGAADVTAAIWDDAITRLRDVTDVDGFAVQESTRSPLLLALLSAELSGRGVRTLYDLTKADVIVTLDCDFQRGHGDSVRLAADLATRRIPEHASASRLYTVESRFTSMGVTADHRLALRSADVGAVLELINEAFGRGTVGARAKTLGDNTEIMAFVDAVKADLQEAGPRGVVLVGDGQPDEVHAQAHGLNASLGAIGTTIELLDDTPLNRIVEVLTGLVRGMDGCAVETLLIMDSKPDGSIRSVKRYHEQYEYGEGGKSSLLLSMSCSRSPLTRRVLEAPKMLVLCGDAGPLGWVATELDRFSGGDVLFRRSDLAERLFKSATLMEGIKRWIDPLEHHYSRGGDLSLLRLVERGWKTLVKRSSRVPKSLVLYEERMPLGTLVIEVLRFSGGQVLFGRISPQERRFKSAILIVSIERGCAPSEYEYDGLGRLSFLNSISCAREALLEQGRTSREMVLLCDDAIPLGALLRELNRFSCGEMQPMSSGPVKRQPCKAAIIVRDARGVVSCVVGHGALGRTDSGDASLHESGAVTVTLRAVKSLLLGSPHDKYACGYLRVQISPWRLAEKIAHCESPHTAAGTPRDVDRLFHGRALVIGFGVTGRDSAIFIWGVERASPLIEHGYDGIGDQPWRLN